MKVKTRLYFSSAISIVLAITFFAVVFWTSDRLEEESVRHDLAMRTKSAIMELNIITNDYLLYFEERAE